MSAEPEVTVTSADFVRHFSEWRLKAASRPVVISNHGKPSHALVKYDQYTQLVRGAAFTSSDGEVGESLATLVSELRDCVIIVDRDSRIVSINRAACDFLRIKPEAVTGKPMLEAFPVLENSYIHRNIARTLRTGERYAGDAPSLLRDGAWLRLDILPVSVGVALMFRDVSEEINAFHMADAKQAIIRAMEVDGSIGYARLSLREAVERADSVLIDMLGTTEDAITRVKFSALMPQGRRAAFARAMEAVLHNEGPQKLASELVGAEGSTVPVNLSLVDLHGAFAPEGVIVVITRREAGA